MSQSLPWWAFALLSAVFAALTTILAKIGLQSAPINPDLATAICTVVIVVIAWGLVFARRSYTPIGAIPTRTLVFLVLSGAATGLSWMCYFRALQIGKASQVAPIDKLSLALVVVFAALVLGERITWQTAVGSAMIVGGTLIFLL